MDLSNLYCPNCGKGEAWPVEGGCFYICSSCKFEFVIVNMPDRTHRPQEIKGR